MAKGHKEDPRIIDLDVTDYTVIDDDKGQSDKTERQPDQKKQERKEGRDAVVDDVKEGVGDTLDFGLGNLSRKALKRKAREAFQMIDQGFEIIDEGNLTPEQEEKVQKFMDGIDDVFNSDSMLDYCLKSQESVSGVAEKLGDMKLGSSSLGPQIMDLNKRIRGEDKVLSLKRSKHPIIRTLGEVLDAIRDGQERRKTLTEVIKSYEELVENYRDILKDDGDVLKASWKQNEADYYDIVYAAIALKRKLDQAEEEVAQDKANFVESDQTDLMLSEVIGKKQDGLTVARQRYDDLRDSALLAVLLSRELRVLGVTVTTMKHEMMRTLNNLIPFIRWSFLMDSIMTDVDMAHNVRESVSKTASMMMESIGERFKEILGKVGASSESPLLSYESMGKTAGSLVDGMLRLEATVEEARKAKEKGYNEVKKQLEVINGKKKLSPEDGRKPKKKK